MNKFKNAAFEILKKAQQPLHYTEITRLALESGILETEGATPENSMSAQLIVDIKNKGKGSDFIKIALGTFALNLEKKDIKETLKIIEDEAKAEEKITIESGYTGKGGRASCLQRTPFSRIQCKYNERGRRYGYCCSQR